MLLEREARLQIAHTEQDMLPSGLRYSRLFINQTREALKACDPALVDRIYLQRKYSIIDTYGYRNMHRSSLRHTLEAVKRHNVRFAKTTRFWVHLIVTKEARRAELGTNANSLMQSGE